MDENAVMRAHFADCARRAARTGRRVFSNFVDPAQAALAIEAANVERVPVEFDGGYPDAERTVAAFGWSEYEDTAWPVIVLSAAWDARFCSCQHRDILGSLMALGVERECFGDIIIDADNARALLFTLERMESLCLLLCLSADWRGTLDT